MIQADEAVPPYFLRRASSGSSRTSRCGWRGGGGHSGAGAGGAGTGDVVERITWHGAGDTLSWAIERHSTTGTILGLSAVLIWFLVR